MPRQVARNRLRAANRTLEAIHLAAAERLPTPMRFLTFDIRQHEAARALGLDAIGLTA